MRQNVETFIGCDAPFAESDIVLFGAPFDSTTSFRPGARFGSAAMRHESFGIETYSPYQTAPSSTAAIWSSASARRNLLSRISAPGPKRSWRRASSP